MKKISVSFYCIDFLIALALGRERDLYKLLTQLQSELQVDLRVLCGLYRYSSVLQCSIPTVFGVGPKASDEDASTFF